MNRRGKRAVFSNEAIERARSIVGEMKHTEPILMAISALLTGVLHLTGDQVGGILGVSVSTVVRMNKRFRQPADQTRRNCWGGDRRSLLNEEEKREVLAGLEQKARKGEIVVVKSVKEAVEAKCGKQVSVQTVYNLLHNEGWRKVVPDKVHPKADLEAQDEFKKKHSRRPWGWLPPTQKGLGSSCA